MLPDNFTEDAGIKIKEADDVYKYELPLHSQ